MNRFLLGCLAVSALALMIGQAVAEATHGHNGQGNHSANNNDGGVVIIETYSASAVPASGNNNDMQPLPGDPGVEVAPDNPTNAEPVAVEEDMMVEETEQGE